MPPRQRPSAGARAPERNDPKHFVRSVDRDPRHGKRAEPSHASRESVDLPFQRRDSRMSKGNPIFTPQAGTIIRDGLGWRVKSGRGMFGAGVMKSVARISHRNGGVLLPAETPYDLQLVDEYLIRYARRYGPVRFELSGRQWTVSPHMGQPATECMSCQEPIAALSCSDGRQIVCRSCCMGERKKRSRPVMLLRALRSAAGA